jgi:hypothetical protein
MTRPICEIEGCCNPSKTNGFNVDGSRRYRALCSQHDYVKHSTVEQRKAKSVRSKVVYMAKIAVTSRYSSKHIKTLVCESCGFIAISPCQIDVHHKDHNHSNNNPENLTNICANCHRLVSYEQRKARSCSSVRASESLFDCVSSW